MNDMPEAGRRFPALVLVVEDDGDDLWFLRRALAALPQRIALAAVPSVGEGLEYLRRVLREADGRRPALILTDVNLPDRPGWELLEWAASCEPLSGVPRLVWTSLPNPEGEARARRLRVVRYVAKPRDLAGYARMAALVAESLGD